MSDSPHIMTASLQVGPQGETWRDDKTVLTLQDKDGVMATFELDVLAVSLLALTIHPCVAALKARAGDDIGGLGFNG